MFQIFRGRHLLPQKNIHRESGFPLEVVQPLKSPSKDKGVFIHGHACLYLGKVPTYESKGMECTDYCVQKLLDRYNIDETSAHDIYLDVKSLQLLFYYTDDDGKLLQTSGFDLPRVSYACGQHISEPKIFSWVYKQETDVGFQLECHAVRCSSARKSQIIAQQLFLACQKLYREMQAGLQSTRVFDETDQVILTDTDTDCDHAALLGGSHSYPQGSERLGSSNSYPQGSDMLGSPYSTQENMRVKGSYAPQESRREGPYPQEEHTRLRGSYSPEEHTRLTCSYSHKEHTRLTGSSYSHQNNTRLGSTHLPEVSNRPVAPATDTFPSMADWEDLHLDNDSVFESSETTSLNNDILELHVNNMREVNCEGVLA